jgi:hypothetical protein
MRRIIQKYQEGGVVQPAPGPAVATGIPQGGHAAAAIQSYLSGQAAGPLSYTAGQSTVPDYRALAAIEKKRRLAEQAAGTAGTTGASAVVDGNTEHSDMMDDSSGQIETLGGGVINYSNAGEKQHAENIAKIIADGGINEKTGQPNISSGPNVLSASDVGLFGIGDTYGQQFQENYDAQSVHAANNPEFGQSTGTPLSEQGFYDNFITDYLNNSMVGTVGKYFTGNEMFPGLLPPDSEVGEGETYMEQLDAFGGAGPVIQSDNSKVDYTPTVTLDTSGGTQTANGLTFNNTYTGGYVDQNIGSGGKAQQRAEQAAQRIKNAEKAAGIALYGSEQAWLNATNGGRNMGGPIGPRVKTYNNGSPGGVSVAKSGLREDEIRQRQLMQARMPQTVASPLSDIGSKLAMGAIDKGIGSAASSMAAKEGLVGTLGTALGGSAATGAATGAAGTGLMAALGPIGIGIGLGKLFGVFNDGGKVPCSCGKTSCKCAKEMKSPLSGE